MSQEMVVANVWLLGVFVSNSGMYQAVCLVMAFGFGLVAFSKRGRS